MVALIIILDSDFRCGYSKANFNIIASIKMVDDITHAPSLFFVLHLCLGFMPFFLFLLFFFFLLFLRRLPWLLLANRHLCKFAHSLCCCCVCKLLQLIFSYSTFSYWLHILKEDRVLKMEWNGGMTWGTGKCVLERQ